MFRGSSSLKGKPVSRDEHEFLKQFRSKSQSNGGQAVDQGRLSGKGDKASRTAPSRLNVHNVEHDTLQGGNGNRKKGRKKGTGNGVVKVASNFVLPQLLAGEAASPVDKYSVRPGRKGPDTMALSALDFQFSLASPGAASAMTEDYSTASEFTFGTGVSPSKVKSSSFVVTKKACTIQRFLLIDFIIV